MEGTRRILQELGVAAPGSLSLYSSVLIHSSSFTEQVPAWLHP